MTTLEVVEHTDSVREYDPYTLGYDTLLRYKEAVIQPLAEVGVETQAQMARRSITDDAIRLLLEEAAFSAHGVTDTSKFRLDFLTRKLMGDPDSEEPRGVVGHKAPRTAENLDALIKHAIIETDPSKQRATEMRDKWSNTVDENGRNLLHVDREDKVLERVSGSLTEAFLFAFSREGFVPPDDPTLSVKDINTLRDAFNEVRVAELCMLTAYGLREGLFRQEVWTIRDNARKAAETINSKEE